MSITDEEGNVYILQMPISSYVRAGKGKVIAKEMHMFHLDSNDYHVDVVRERLELDGYVMIRGFLDVDDVFEARALLLKNLCQRFPLAPGGPIQTNIGLIDRQDLAKAGPVRHILESPRLYQLLRRLLGEEVITTSFKWLRAVGNLQFTGVHMDKVFVGGSPRTLTVWIPIGNVPAWHGPIMVCRGSHRLPEFSEIQRTYGQTKVGPDGTNSGWLFDDGAAVEREVGCAVDWRTAHFWAGDIVILDNRVLHMSATNISGEMRLSCDTRWQPRGDPRDPKIADWQQQFPDEE